VRANAHFTQSRHTPKAVTFCQFIAHSLTLLLSPYDSHTHSLWHAFSFPLRLTPMFTERHCSSSILLLLFCFSFSFPARAHHSPVQSQYTCPLPPAPHSLSYHALSLSFCLAVLLLFIIWLLLLVLLLLLLLLGALKGLICICTLWVLCVTLFHPLPSLFPLALSLPLPFGTCPKPESTMFIIIRLLLSYTFEGWLSFYWVSRAFCYPIILR